MPWCGYYSWIKDKKTLMKTAQVMMWSKCSCMVIWAELELESSLQSFHSFFKETYVHRHTVLAHLNYFTFMCHFFICVFLRISMTSLNFRKWLPYKLVLWHTDYIVCQDYIISYISSYIPHSHSHHLWLLLSDWQKFSS